MKYLGLLERSDSATRFSVARRHVWLSELCGQTLAAPQADNGPLGTQGLTSLSTDLGRVEGQDWQLASCTQRRDTIRMRLLACSGAVALDSTWSACPHTRVVRRVDLLRNTSRKALTVYRCQARVALPPGDYEVYSQASRWCHENQGRWTPLHAGAIRLGCTPGRTTQGGTPYACIRAQGGSGGLAFHILPLGNWSIAIRTCTSGDSHLFAVVELGVADEDLHLVLRPGETLALPHLLFQPLPQGLPQSAAAALHEYLLRTDFKAAKPRAPIVYNTWFDQFELLDVPRLRRQLAAAKKAGCEVFVIDAGWYGAGSPNWYMQAGDWREKTGAAFDGRMRRFADEVRAAGVGFGLWMEPERCGPDVPVRRAHPDWFIPRSGTFARFDLERPAPRAWLCGQISRLVNRYTLAWMKIDFNFDLERDASGTELLRYYESWYALLDEVRAAHPGTFFEGCSSGAMRLDLNSLSHTDGHFLSDSVEPVDMLRISQGAFLRLPPGRLTRWAVLRAAPGVLPTYGRTAAESPAAILAPGGAVWEPAETVDLNFALLAAMPGMLGLSGDLAGLPDDALFRIRAHTRFYARWRTFLTGAVCHLLTPPELQSVRSGWIAFQLQQPRRSTSLVLVYRLGVSGPMPRLQLQGLDATERYTATFGIDAAERRQMRGSELIQNGLPVPMPPVGSSRTHAATVAVVTPLPRR